MAGTDKSMTTQNLNAPAIILVRPQLGENIGMCARAMLNCGVTELRIVAPRDGWPNDAAVAAASGAIDVLNGAKIFNTTAEAIADLDFVIATTARGRELMKEIYTPNTAAKEIHARGKKSGILFGPERTGLENDDVAQANAILNIPLNPGFSSLNLAQAVLLVCYTWLSSDNPYQPTTAPEHEDALPAPKKDVEFLLTQMEDELAQGGFFRSLEQRPTIMRNIRNFFFRAAPSVQEVRTLHGIVSCLTGKRRKG